MKLTISLKGAPTDNARHIIARGQNRLIDSSKYREWKEGAIWEVKRALGAIKGWKTLVPSYTTQIPYRIKVYMESKRTDHTNYMKGVQDVLVQGGVFNDDKWIFPLFSPCEIDVKNPRVEIEI